MVWYYSFVVFPWRWRFPSHQHIHLIEAHGQTSHHTTGCPHLIALLGVRSGQRVTPVAAKHALFSLEEVTDLFSGGFRCSLSLSNMTSILFLHALKQSRANIRIKARQGKTLSEHGFSSFSERSQGGNNPFPRCLPTPFSLLLERLWAFPSLVLPNKPLKYINSPCRLSEVYWSYQADSTQLHSKEESYSSWLLRPSLKRSRDI